MLIVPQYFLSQCQYNEISHLARIVRLEKAHLVLLNQNLEEIMISKPKGKDYFLGDWVLFDGTKIQRSLNSLKTFERWKDHSSQIICQNASTLWIVSSANSDLNYNRIERYLKLAKDSDLVPVIIVTKIDLIDNLAKENLKKELYLRFPNIALHLISTLTREELPSLNYYFKPQETIILMGSSGVGKSTLINHLLQVNLDTQDIRKDGKGRHTTTHRQMFYKEGAFIADNPGIRSVGSIQKETPVGCYFLNCQHNGDKGCQFESQESHNKLKILRENEYLNSKYDIELKKKRQLDWKNVSKNSRKMRKEKSLNRKF